MDRDLQKRLLSFVRPLYQGLDGVSGVDDVERIARIARIIHQPGNSADERSFELLLLFQGLGKWLEKVGSASRASLAVSGISESELRMTAAAIARLHDPRTDAERAVAAALLIDRAGLRGLACRFAEARREGRSLTDVVREAVSDARIPDWVPLPARDLLVRRFDARRRFCEQLLEEM